MSDTTIESVVESVRNGDTAPSVLTQIDQLPPAPKTINGDDVVRVIADGAWFSERTEQTVDGLKTEVRDKAGKLRYIEIHPAYYDGARYIKAVPAVVDADAGDAAQIKSAGAMDKYGFSQAGWIIGIKQRSNGKQLLSKPFALTRHSGAHTTKNIEAGIYEYAQYATAFGEDAGRAAKWVGIFRDCAIRAEITDGGALSVQHAWKKEAVDGSEWYGVIYEVNTTAHEYLQLIQPDGQHDTRLQAYTPKDGKQYIVEYFPLEQFQVKDEKDQKPTGELRDVTHEYTTIAGDLAAPLALDRGSTYYLSAMCNLGAHNVTTSGAAGRITVKTDAVYGFRLNSTGTFIVSYIDFTSKNDNSLGSTVVGSSGVAASADQTVGYVIRTGTDTTAITINNFTAWYATVTSAPLFGWTANAAASTLTLAGGRVYYCSLGAGGGGDTCFVGGNETIGAINISNLAIGATNSCATTSGKGIQLVLQVQNTILDNVLYEATGEHSVGVDVTPLSADVAVTVSNCRVRVNVALTAVRGAVWLSSQSANTFTFTVKNCTVENTGVGYGLCFYRSAGTINASVINNIITNCDGVSAVGLYRNTSTNTTVTHTHNRYWNNTTNAFEALHATEAVADPQFGNLPTGCVIDTALCPFPDGYAVGNLSGYEMLGSDTFDALSVDEAIYTATGYRYAGTKNVTPGAMYALTTFPELLTSITPASGSVDGATPCTLAVRGAGATQSTGTVTIGGDAAATYTAWADTSIGITTRLNTAGAKDVVLTTYRGAVITLAGGYTYVEPTITSVTPSSGRIGTIVTIVGTEYHDTQGSGTVTQGVGGAVFGTVVSWADKKIVLSVLAGTGLIDVTVVTGL